MANLTDEVYCQLVLWGGDLVVITKDVKVKKRLVPKGTEFRVEMSRGKIAAAPNEKVTLCFSARKQMPGSFLWRTETVEVPAMYLQRVMKSDDYPTGYGNSLSVLSERGGGLCMPK